jgi:prepilin signal peptidase PulO-like enzyme (type II secretory pathway)
MQDVIALLATFVAGVAAGAAVNWAVYALAWNRRLISPWSPADPKAPPRRASDRAPVWGWFGLRREEPLHGRGFWVRPLVVELMMGVGIAALWWWEVARQGLVGAQFAALADGALPAGVLAAPAWTTYATFASHALLVALMAAASLIDIDEKTIPDGITVPGTLLGLVLAAVVPMSLPPLVAVRSAPPAAGAAIALPADVGPVEGALYVEPTTLAAPGAWPASLGGAPKGQGLVVGLACYATWCIALAPRWLRRRRGWWFGLRVVAARVLRELSRPPLLGIALAGAAGITAAWFVGGATWVGLLTALVGMIGGSALVWAVRIAATHALRREALGFGDVTLMMMVGAFLGWQAGVLIFFAAPFAAMAVALLQLVLRRTDEIFFGPFLCLATVAVMVRWATVWNADSAILHVFLDPWLVAGVLAGGVAVMWAMLVLWRNFKEAMFGAREPE